MAYSIVGEVPNNSAPNKTYFPSHFNVEQIFRALVEGVVNPSYDTGNRFKKLVNIDGYSFEVYTMFYNASNINRVVDLKSLSTSFGKII